MTYVAATLYLLGAYCAGKELLDNDLGYKGWMFTILWPLLVTYGIVTDLEDYFKTRKQ